MIEYLTKTYTYTIYTMHGHRIECTFRPVCVIGMNLHAQLTIKKTQTVHFIQSQLYRHYTICGPCCSQHPRTAGKGRSGLRFSTIHATK